MSKSRVDLDNLLHKYVEQNMWRNEDGDIEPIDDVLEKVSKRFNIIRHEEVKGDGRPKREHIPFYSRENDIFADYEAARNLFKEGENPEDLAIGVLSKFERPIDYSKPAISGEILWDIFSMVANRFKQYFNPKEIIKLEKTKDNHGSIIPFLSINVFNQTMMSHINYELTRIHKSYINSIYGRAVCGNNIDELAFNQELTSRIVLSALNGLNDVFMFLLKEAMDDFLRMSPTHYRGFRALRVILENPGKLSKSEFEATFDEANDFMFTLSRILWSNCRERILTDMHRFQSAFEKSIFKELDRWDNKDSVDISEISRSKEVVLDAIRIVTNYPTGDGIRIHVDGIEVTPNISSYLDIPEDIDYVPKRKLNERFGRWS